MDFPIRLTLANGLLHVAGGDGQVMALAPGDGAVAWQADVGARLTAGVGSDGRRAAVVDRQGTLHVLQGGQGAWRQRLPAPVATAPFVAGDRVFVQSIDRAVHAFDADTGSRLWSQPRGGDALTLTQAGVMTAVGNVLLLGQGGRLLGLDPLTGRTLWSQVISNPRGTNELERLVDLVGQVGRVGDLVCVRAYQSVIGCVDARRGALRWVRPSVGTVGVDADQQHVYSVESSGRVVAHRLAGGEVAWSIDALLFRGVGTPLVMGEWLLVGDAQGYVHVLEAGNGRLAGRFSTDGSSIIGSAARSGQTAVFVTARGGVHAFRLGPQA